jgi:cyclopropane fatty-acyl-phospholipid synthase-like methyltransferase
MSGDGGAVGAYYDASTRRFLRVGGSKQALAIHRGLWAEGVATPEAAAAHVNDLIRARAEAALGRIPARVVDLGCGVGGSAFHLARHWTETEFLGITISALQVRDAQAEADARGLSSRCRFGLADFTKADPSEARAELAIAIESHVHAPAAATFLTGVRDRIAVGGVLIVVDDMLLGPEALLPPRDRRLVETFRKGWRLGHVPDRASFATEAGAAGFHVEAVEDLTPLLRLDRWRDLALHAVAPVVDRAGLNRWPLFGNMIGGDALTRAYRRGIMAYTLAVLRRAADSA